MAGVLELVAFDIETTGFAVTDVVTVVGFALPLGVRVFVQTDGRPAGDVESKVGERVDRPVQVSVHECERALLRAVERFAAERLVDEEVLIVAYNGQRWKGGFDLPFLRSRYAVLDEAWPFQEVPYADLLPVLTRRFNTTGGDGDSRSDLPGVYEVLCAGSAGGLDPFTESSEAVAAFEDGEFVPLVLHNVADVVRTRELGRLAQRYCSKSDFKLTSLTSISHAQE